MGFVRRKHLGGAVAADSEVTGLLDRNRRRRRPIVLERSALIIA